MSSVTRRTIAGLALLAVVALAALAVVVASGIYNVAADEPHWRGTYALLETARDRSIDTRANELTVPTGLDDPDRIRQGAGNYAAMCTGCHLAPGMAATEMSQGLYPAPPDLTKQTVDAARAFWVIKHGIKASGMPAWGKSMDDAYIWNMAAFLQELPDLDATRYAALVASSGGHSHGGGETAPHPATAGAQAGEGGAHPHDGGNDHHDGAAATGRATPHAHAPGTPPHDDAPKAASTATPKPHAHAPGTPPHDDAPSAASAGAASRAPDPTSHEQGDVKEADTEPAAHDHQH